MPKNKKTANFSLSPVLIFEPSLAFFFVCDMKRVYLCTCYLLVWTAGAVVEHTLCSDSAEFVFFPRCAHVWNLKNSLLFTCKQAYLHLFALVSGFILVGFNELWIQGCTAYSNDPFFIFCTAVSFTSPFKVFVMHVHIKTIINHSHSQDITSLSET